MTRVVSATNYSNLCPQSHGIVFNSRDQSASASRSSTRSSGGSNGSSSSNGIRSPGRSISTTSSAPEPDPTLSPVDIEWILLQKTAAKEDELKKAFQTLDVDQTLKITNGEFRRVIEMFIFPLTNEQFNFLLAKIPGSNTVSVPYLEFMSIFGKPVDPVYMKLTNGGVSRTKTLSQLECLLREKISKKLKQFIKTCRLFDYNQNGQIQRHELRRILEINCFRMTDCEYEKLWNRYCVCRTNTLNYKEFLQYLGINLDKKKKRSKESQDSGRQNEPPEKKKSESKTLLPLTAGYNLTKIHLDTTARNFREKMRSAYEDIVKAFRAFDVGRSGFVSLEYLKSVLSTFIFPIRSDVFQELMNRFGIKISQNMPWEKFLEKFQDPWRFDMSRASPIAKQHKTRKLDEDVSSDRILLKLHGHIQDAYSSLKKAFLTLDRNQDGKITRNELRRILDCVMFRISDDDFQELIKIIDPEHTGHLSYNKFLNLFEERNGMTDSKMKGGSKKDDKSTAFLEAWKIAEDVITEQIKGYWIEFCKALQACDPQNNGIVSRNNFRKVLQLYFPTLNDDHFIALYQKYQDDATEGVLYRMLLHSLGVSDLPKELIPKPSTPSLEESQQKDGKKLMDPSERLKHMEDNVYRYTRNRTVDDVIERLRDGILQQEATLRDVFLAYNKEASGKLNKLDFQKLLDNIGLPMNDDQFNLLIEKIGFPAGGMSYLDFVAIFEDSRLSGRTASQRGSGSKCHFMSAEECINQYCEKLMSEYGDPYAAFRKIDQNNDGIITMLDFRRLLSSFMINISDDEYGRLLELLGMNITSTLNYPEFLQLFQAHATKEMRPWLTPSQKTKQIAADADLACEQAHYYLSNKAQNRWNDLAMHFHEYDSDGNGLILKKELKDILYRFGIPMNPRELERLWSRYDVDEKGYLTQKEFLQKVGAENVSPDIGINKTFMAENYVRFMDPYKMEKKKHIDINEIIRKIREKYHTCSQDFHRAFLEQDKNKEGYITVKNLRKMLEDFQCCLGYEQYSELLYSLGISIQDNRLSYFDFLRAIDDRAAFKRRRRSTVPPVPPISFVQLSIDEAMRKIKHIVTESSDLLHKAFSAFDKDRTGLISTLDFRQVLHHFCFPLSERQFNHLLKLQRLRSENCIDWKYFLQKFNFLSESEREHSKFACRELSNQEVFARVHEVVSARFQAIEQEFKKLDFAKEKVISKEAFRDICNQHFLLLTDEQFDNLWNTVPLDANGKLKYFGFLKMFTSEGQKMPELPAANCPDVPSKPGTAAEPVLGPASRPRTASPSALQKTSGGSRPHTAAVQPSPILNCKPIEIKVRKVVQHCWREILKDCREKDVDRQGEISTEDFLAIIEKFHLNLTKEELDQLVTKYDFKSVGKFAYCDFLQSCVLLFKQQEVSPMQRIVIQNPRVQKPHGPQSPTFFNAMLRIQPQILHCWRPMRRTFKIYDETGSGFLSIQDFRQVLRKYGINLCEEEFFHILEYYDKTLTSKISYNEFLRAFLQ